MKLIPQNLSRTRKVLLARLLSGKIPIITLKDNYANA
jgi:hypothetical protein